jgi:hypothetical protein
VELFASPESSDALLVLLKVELDANFDLARHTSPCYRDLDTG